ncbi:MAG: PD40 domain-containing protein [Myxococcales bacterium]|nr:PD40 domain-containing protein [Myxococcales bacterium]MCB9583488.1 PD40 domain-containing protein [Polyangiaceae bacterium]
MNSARRTGLAALVGLALSAVAAPARAGDPYLEWYTVKSPHFRVTYHSGLEVPAQRVATLGEAVYRRLVPELAWEPSEVTEVLLTDVTDSANGSATALPYNAVRLFVSAPDDMSPLGDYDDWLSELITHEYVHILHVDNISGIPAILNSILGKTYAPNQAQPRWILEGLAVALESEHTGGGRLRSSQFDMYLRADVLENRLARLDQISNPARRWPSGNLWYLYGGKFIGWIADVYGPDTFAAVATDYGSNVIPWGVNRSIKRATGRTYPELYKGWEHYLSQKYGRQMAEVARRGLREGTRLTHRGRVASSPRFVPACARAGSREEVLYYRDDGDTPPGFYRVPLDARDRADESDAEIVSKSAGRVASYEPSCGFVFDSVAPSERRYYFNDLFRQPKGTTAPRGLSKSRQRLTKGRRARDPDVSPDGRHVAYVTNHAGTSTLQIAEITTEGRIVRQRTLVPSARYEQAFTPRFSPDGQSVAYSAWTAGGYRDVRVVDVNSGRFYQVTRDTALDQQPTFSPDGKRVFFSSDRTGISNIYVYEIESGKLSMVTNVKTGAFMPEVTPDGRTLFYIGYTADGFDLFSMPLDAARYLKAPPPPGPRPIPHPDPPRRHYPVEEYNPLPTLRPRAYELKLGPGTFGDALSIITRGSDIVGHHAFALSLLVESPDQGEVSGSAAYAYRRLPFDFSASLFRRVAPRTGYRYGDHQPVFVERQIGARTGIGYSIPGEFDAQFLNLSYTAMKFDSDLPVGTLGDPYAQVTRDPHRGFLGQVSLGYFYSNADGTVYGIGPERGFTLALGADFAGEETGSDDTLTSFTGRATGYLPMPWADHHVIAAALSGGAAVGTYPRRGLFFAGGFVDLPVLDAFTDGVYQSAFVLRGYQPAQFIGTQFNLLNAEYRFPILYADRGISTLPVFLRTISGSVFADYGGAFNQMDLEKPFDLYHLGVGAELWFDLVLGYYGRGNVRIGHARGTDSEAVSGGQTYVVVSSAF